MKKIIIKGNFTIETDYAFMENFKQPLEYFEIDLFEQLPFKVGRIKSASSNDKSNSVPEKVVQNGSVPENEEKKQ